MANQKESGQIRWHLIDGIRGLAIVNMIAFHFLFDWHEIFHGNTEWYWSMPVRIWQQWICCTFILVAGFSWTWGKRNNLKRGLFLNACGCLISLVMWLFLPEEAIWFGILNFYGCAVLLTIPAEKFLRSVPPLFGLAAAGILFVLTRDLQLGYIGLPGYPLLRLPEILYRWKPMTVLGFPFPGFRSSDYYPMLPWYFLFLCGFALHRLASMLPAGTEQAKPSLPAVLRCRIPFLSELGTKSIWIYMLHQPVCYLAAALLTKLG